MTARILAALLCLLPAVALGGSIYAPATTTTSIGAQPVDATLTALSGGACVADTLLYCDGADTVAAGTLTAAGRAIIDDATAADQRTTLGLGALCTGADAADVPYTPAVLADWNGAADPGDADNALDQLAERVTDSQAGDATLTALAATTYTAGTELISRTAADTFGTLNVGTAASNIVQLTAAAKLPAVDGSLLTGISAGGPYDWASTDSTVVPGDWADAGGAFGATNDHCVETVQSVLLRSNGALDADCSTALTGDRALGVLIAVGANDFTRYFRVGVRRALAIDAAASYVLGGVVFVDGADASAAWYSNMLYYAATSVAISNYTYADTTAAAGNWQSAGTGTALGITYAPITTWDFVIQRSGTDLHMWMAPAGGMLMLAHTYAGVSTGAGFVGIRSQTISGTTDDPTVILYAYRTNLTVIP